MLVHIRGINIIGRLGRLEWFCDSAYISIFREGSISQLEDMYKDMNGRPWRQRRGREEGSSG